MGNTAYAKRRQSCFSLTNLPYLVCWADFNYLAPRGVAGYLPEVKVTSWPVGFFPLALPQPMIPIRQPLCNFLGG